MLTETSTRRYSGWWKTPETIVTGGDHGLPYSKGLMAQSLSASGLSPERAYELARIIEHRLDERGERRIDVAGLRELAEGVIRAEEGEQAVRHFRGWAQLDRLERPLIVMLGGTAGVGKSSLATMLAARLGITRVIPTDVIRQVLRAFFSREFMPAVHYSSFEASEALNGGSALAPADDDLAGFAEQAQTVATGVNAIVERACEEGTPMVVEGVHLVAGLLDDALRRRCVLVEALLVVEDEDLHRGHFSLRGGKRPADRYLDRFGEIRRLQSFLVEHARDRNVAVIDNLSIDTTLSRSIDLVLDTVGDVSSSTG